ncbi:MAG: YtxH domain-containing protein [Staphylococcus lugdunensis]|nr:YtxH domain-containing protein [Staphylococcus lugdunensis]
MKATRIIFGLGVGIAAGVAVTFLNRDNQSVKNATIDAKEPTGTNSELEREIENLKHNVYNVIDYTKQIKNESTAYASSIGDEIKSLIGNFKADINPNIEQLQSHIENLQNLGQQISEELSSDKN